VLINNKIIEARHVQVIEKGTKLIFLQKKNKNSDYVNLKLNDYDCESDHDGSENESENEICNENLKDLSLNSTENEEFFCRCAS